MTLDDYRRALIAADAAGDAEGARILATQIRALEAGAPDASAQATPPAAAAGAPSRGGSTASGLRLGGVPDPAQAEARGAMKSGLQQAGRALPQIAAEGVKQATAVAMLPGEALRYGLNQLGGDNPEWAPGTKMVQGAVDRAIPPPETRGGRRAAAIGGGALAGMAFPGSPVRNAFTGLLGAAGGEAGAAVGGQMAGENGQIIGGGLGSLLGFANAAYKSPGGYEEMLADAVKGLKPNDFAAARTRASQARGTGVDLTPEQAFDYPTGLDTLMRETLESGAGSGRLQEVLLNQRKNAEAAIAGAENRFGPRVGTRPATRDLREATAGAIAAEGRLSESGKALYGDNQGLRATGQQLTALKAQLAALEKDIPVPEIRARITKLRETIESAEKKITFEVPTQTQKLVKPERGVAKRLMKTEPGVEKVEASLGADTSDLSLIANYAKGELQDIKLNTPGIERLTTGKVGAGISRVDALLDEIITTRPEADALFRSAQERANNLKSGLAGQLAGKTGPDQAAPDTLGLLRSALTSDKLQKDEIAELASVLRVRAANLRAEAQRVGPRDDVLGAELMAQSQQAERALLQATREIFSESVGRAMRSGGEGRTPPNFGALLHDDLMGTLAKKENFRQLLQAVAPNGSKDFVNGVENLLETLKMSSRNRQGINFSAGDIQAAAGNSPLRDAAQAAGPLARMALISNKLKQRAYERQYSKLADIFTDPDAIAKIEQIGRTSRITSRQGALATALMQSLQNRQENQDAP